MTDNEPGFVVTIKDIYGEVIATKQAVNILSSEVKESRRTDVDHEGRLRNLERWMYGIPASIIIAIIGAIVAFMKG